MRMMMTVSIPVDSGNVAIRDGSLESTIERILADLNPESAYFTEEGGQRTLYIVFDMKDSSQWPAVSEPWFLAFHARVRVKPAMTLDDMSRAAPAVERVVKAFGRGATS